MECEPLGKITLTEQIMERIAGMATSSQLKPDDKLLNKRDLAGLSGVTGSRVWEVLGAFSLVGMLTIELGDSSFVSEGGTKAPGETVMWMYYQEMNEHDEIYAARNLIEIEVYLTCYDNRTPEILERLDGFRDRLLSVETKEATAGVFCQLLTDIDIYVGDVRGNGIYVGLIQIMVLTRKELAMKILSLASFGESTVFYHCRILDSLHQDDRNKIKKYLNDSLEYLIREISIQG